MKKTLVSPDRCSEILSKFSSASVMVLGDAMLDEYWWGEVSRISPEAPVPIVEVRSTSLKLGGAANVAGNLKSLGIKPFLATLCGTDANGDRLRALLGEGGQTAEGIVSSNSRPTTLKTRIVAQHQQIVRADHEAVHDLTDDEFTSLWHPVQEQVRKVQAIILSDYGKGVLSFRLVRAVIEESRKHGVFVAVDPKKRYFEEYSGANLITPNFKEALAAMGFPPTVYSIELVQRMGWELIDKHSLPLLLITLGEKGMALFNADGRSFFHLETAAKKVYDVTGAGDTVISCFTAAMACGALPIEAAWLANHAAGLTVAELGTATVDADSLLAACGA